MAVQFGFAYDDSTRGGTVLVARILRGASAPEVFSARFVPAESGSEMRGFGTTEAEAISDLFRAERDMVAAYGRPLPDFPEPDGD